jgi:hypothetical protein
MRPSFSTVMPAKRSPTCASSVFEPSDATLRISPSFVPT